MNNRTRPFLINVSYCKFGNIHEHFIFSNSIKTHICDVINSRQWRNLLKSVNDRVKLPIYEESIFMNPQSFAKINPLENFRIYSNILTFFFIELSGVA